MNIIKKDSIKCRVNPIILYQILIDLLPVQNNELAPNLINNILDIIEIIKSQKRDKWKYIYFNNKNINQLLYNDDKNINIDITDVEIFKNFEYSFYLDYLILNDEEIINYTFTKNFIIQIFENLKLVSCSNKYMELIILSKIVLNMINNYKSCDFYDEDYDEKELDEIENYCKEIINEHLNIFEEIELDITEDEFYSSPTYEIYIKCIKALIKLDKFENYEFINKIANNLNLEKIHIPEKMFDGLNKILNMEYDCAKSYLIQKVEDLFNVKIINFYYFMLKYVYKTPFYFFQVPLLLYVRNVIIFILRKNLDLLCYFRMKNEQNEELIEHVDYVIMKITDNKYYYDKYINNYRLGKLKTLLLSENFFFESNNNEIKIIKNIINNKRTEKYEAILMNKEIKIIFEKISVRLEMINNLEHKDLHLANIFINEEQLKNFGNKWKLTEKCIKDKKLSKLLRNNKIKLYKKIFTNEKISDKVQAIFSKDEIQDFIEENKELVKSNLSAESRLMARALDSIDYQYNYDKKFDSSSILIQSYIISANSKSFSNTKSFSRLIKNDNLEDFKKGKDRFTKSDKYIIINHVAVIGRHKGAAEYIRQLSNGQYMSGGSENKLYIYEKTIMLSKSLDMKESQYNIYEVESENKKENEINLMSFSQNKIYYCTLDTKNKEIKTNGKLKNSSLISVYKLDKKSSLIVGLEKIAKIDNEWNLKNINIKSLYNLDMFCRGGKLLNFEIEQTEQTERIVQIFALTSNDEIPNGKNMMIFYDYEKNKISYRINQFSFVASYNNLIEVNQSINSHIKYLLVSCKKKNNNNNKISEINGILLIKINIKIIKKEYELKYNYDFVETESFEVSCFCQLLLVENNNSIYDDITYEKNIIIKQTEYILLGGFDSERRIGCIKLYKFKKDILNEENIDNLKNKLEYLQDIDIEKNQEFQGFAGKISCITQSTITGNILVTCWDGTVHLFRPPNLDSYNLF